MENILINNPSQELIELFSFKDWRQRISLDKALCTPGLRSSKEWDYCWLPKKLQGKTFLDVGANDGMFSFLAEERGAKVTAIDLYKLDGDESYHMTDGWPISRINIIKKYKNSQVAVESISIYDLQAQGWMFDYVFCGNVLAWLKNPFLALENLTACCGETLIIREDISRVKGAPLLEYKNNREFTNCYFNGNEAYYTEVLHGLGFKTIEFKEVDEFEIMENKNRDFPTVSVRKDVDVYRNPFTDEVISKLEKKTIATVSAVINGKAFISGLGWFMNEDAQRIERKLSSIRSIREKINRYRFEKNSLRNCIIYATR